MQNFTGFKFREQKDLLPNNVKVKVKSLSRVWLFVTPWTVAYKAPPSMGFSRQEYWSGLPFPSPGDLPDPGIEPRSPALQKDSLPAEPQGKPRILERVAYPFSSGSSRPRNQTRISCITGGFSTSWAILYCLFFSMYLLVFPIKLWSFSDRNSWLLHPWHAQALLNVFL